MTEALWIGLVVGINVLFRQVFNFIIQRAKVLSGRRSASSGQRRRGKEPLPQKMQKSILWKPPAKDKVG